MNHIYWIGLNDTINKKRYKLCVRFDLNQKQNQSKPYGLLQFHNRPIYTFVIGSTLVCVSLCMCALIWLFSTSFHLFVRLFKIRTQFKCNSVHIKKQISDSSLRCNCYEVFLCVCFFFIHFDVQNIRFSPLNSSMSSCCACDQCNTINALKKPTSKNDLINE